MTRSDLDEYYSCEATYSEEENDGGSDEFVLENPEDLQDWHSEELLDVWMSIVEYHEDWYLPLNRTFNQFCHFVLFQEKDEEEERLHDAVRLISSRYPLIIQGRDWEYFFSLRYK